MATYTVTITTNTGSIVKWTIFDAPDSPRAIERATAEYLERAEQVATEFGELTPEVVSAKARRHPESRRQAPVTPNYRY